MISRTTIQKENKAWFIWSLMLKRRDTYMCYLHMDKYVVH